MNRLIPLTTYREYPQEEMLRRSNSFREEMLTRRTVRDFSPEPVSFEIIQDCLIVAGSAPSGANSQPWQFVVVSDPAMKRRIRIAAEREEYAFYHGRAPREWLDAVEPLGTDEHKPFLETAPYIIAIFAKGFEHLDDGRKLKNYHVNESVGIATGMLISAIHHAGLVSLAHSVNPMGFLNEVLERPPNERPFLMLIVGYPAADATVPDITKKSLGDYATFI